MSRWTPAREAKHIRRLLELYRVDLVQYDQRASFWGGAEAAPVELRHQIANTAREMARLEGRLREIEARQGGEG